MSDKLDIYEFGRQLLQTQDLDPVYVLLYQAGLDDEHLYSWLLAYWAFYHVGTASWITQGATNPKAYWLRFRTAAGSKEYPRSSERRHYRGENARKSVEYLQRRGVYDIFSELLSVGNQAEDVMEVVKRWYGFGPWISFKVADMLERLGIAPVEFQLSTIMYDSPTKAALMLWDVELGQAQRGTNQECGEWAINQILDVLGQHQAPPRYERIINAQEAETVLCKWKSYMGGHYHVGEDVEACRNGLERFSHCSISQQLIRAGKKGGLW